jgi:hypothetical protein
MSVDRRRLLKGIGAAAAVGAVGAMGVPVLHRADRAVAASDATAGCPIPWRPNALEPVFYGIREYTEQAGAPTDLRVFYPSLDGAPAGAEMLRGCGRYPLILFFHGDCDQPGGGDEEYRRWTHLPAQLARSGYVVAVPRIPGIAAFPPEAAQTQDLLADVATWMRVTWEHRTTLMPPPATGLIGHSNGALHAGILARRIGVAGVVSLSGEWTLWQSKHGPVPIRSGSVPRLFTWGTGLDAHAQLATSLWNTIPRPRHRAIFDGAGHWDYLHHTKVDVGCTGIGDCPNVGEATTDLVTMFFANYLPPQGSPDLPDRVPNQLVPPPPLQLTPQQQAYAGGHLIGWKTMGGPDCRVQVTTEEITNVTVPDVRNRTMSEAAAMVQQRGLVPRFTGPTGPGTPRVLAQTPNPGVSVAVGTEVFMALRVGF